MIGIDIVEIKRIENFYKKHGRKGYERFLRPEEFESIKSPQTAAGFWAAKEATSKALGCGIGKICSFHDIWIHKDKNNKPYITLSNEIIEKFKITSLDISISHDGGFAIAVAQVQSKLKTKHPLSH